jgi:U3 small nucleolar RNA-associated protein 23
MHQYHLHFGFREPYQVLLDAGTIKDAARFKMKLGSMLENTLHGPIKPMITQCCIRHLYDLSTSTPQDQAEKDNWIAAAKSAERRRCGHHELEEPLSTVECLESVVDPKGSGRNKHRYVVASQDQEVRKKMRTIAGVPLVYINRSVMILEPMAMATEDVRSKEERLKMRSGLKSRRQSAGVKRKRDDGDDNADAEAESEPQAEEEPKKRKIRGTKGPNPLSVMKPKKTKTQYPPATGGDSQAARSVAPADVKQQKAISADTNSDPMSGAISNESGKRKRKRKPKEFNEDATATVED